MKMFVQTTDKESEGFPISK